MKTLSYLVVCVLAASAVIFNGCNFGASNPPDEVQTGAAFKVLTRNDAGKTFTFDPGAVFRLELASNATTGYAWKATKRGDSVTIMKSTYVPDDHPPGVVGSGGREIFACKAVGRGETTIRLTDRQPWEHGGAGETIEFRIVVR